MRTSFLPAGRIFHNGLGDFRGACVQFARMNTLLLRFLTIVCSGLLVLPPGWCGSLMHDDGRDTAPAADTCCHCPNPEQPTDPAPATVRCCCGQNAILRDNSLEPTVPVDAGWPLLMNAADVAICGPVPGVAVYAPAPSGRSLNVLHCVWRC